MNLNDNLQPQDSPVANYQGAVSAYEFDAANERNTVDLSKIKNFSFNSGQGGTLRLGGTANGNGLMQVRDASGNLITQLDNAGLSIFSGNIAIQNANNTTILDTSGIVSTANFPVENVEIVGVNTTTSTSAVDFPGSSLDPFVLTRAAKGLVSLSAWGYNLKWLSNASSMQVQAVDSVDGTLNSFPLYINAKLSSVSGASSPYTSFSYAADYQYMSASVICDFSAGTHTLKAQYYVNGSGTAEVAILQLGCVIFGS